MLKKIVILLLAAAMLLLSSCGASEPADSTKISFLQSVDIDKINSLNGKTVTITGYMATLSPVNGKYMYLMNLPYQSCPFCVPNTAQLSNTLAVYAKSGKSFDYTDRAITVTGTVETGDFTDDYGYTYNYRITNATYTEVDLSSADSEKLSLWYSIASDGIVAEINSMLDYLYFISQWTEYYVTGENGEIAYYLYPSDVYNYLKSEEAYGYADKYAESYFPSLIKQIRAISPDKLESLVRVVEEAQKAAKAALAELDAGNYTYVPYEKVEGEYRYTLNKSTELSEKFDEVYALFSVWLTEWEL